MKRKIFLALLVAGAASMTSCGLDEAKEYLRHPVYIQGEVDPSFGVPLAKGSVTINEMLGMFSSSYDGIMNTDSNTITIMFDASVTDSIVAQSLMGGSSTKKHHKPHRIATKDVLLSQDTTISYGVDLTIFDDVSMQEIVDGNIQVNHMWLTFDASVQGDCPASLRSKISQYVSAQFDSLVISYIDHNGVSHDFDGAPVINMDFSDVLSEQNIHQANIDIAPIVNSLPRHIDVSFRFRFNIDETVFGDLSDIAHFNELLDSIGLTKLTYTASVHLDMPFDISIGALPYEFELDLGEDGLSSLNLQSTLDSISNGLDVDLKDSRLTLAFENSIPFDMRLMATFLDANGVPLGTELLKDTIKAADVAPATDGSGAYESIGPKHSEASIHLDSKRLEDLNKARKIKFNLVLATTATDGSGNPVPVRIRRTDELDIRVYAIVHPGVSANIRLIENGIF